MNEEVNKIKNKIKELRSYIYTDYCNDPSEVYKEIEIYQRKLIELQKKESR